MNVKYNPTVKRLIDFIIALTLSPIILIICVIVGPIIYLEDNGDIFYKAKRRGVDGRIFSMLKFRSMKMNSPDLRNRDNSTYNSADDPRLTKVGKVLRKSSIDELPQVFNVLVGDMSFVGPRAPIPKDGILWEDLTVRQQKRLKVRPGITGYSAALYRNSINQEAKLEYDCYYVDHVCFVLDFKIVMLTIKKVLLRKDIYNVDN